MNELTPHSNPLPQGERGLSIIVPPPLTGDHPIDSPPLTGGDKGEGEACKIFKSFTVKGIFV